MSGFRVRGRMRLGRTRTAQGQRGDGARRVLVLIVPQQAIEIDLKDTGGHVSEGADGGSGVLQVCNGTRQRMSGRVPVSHCNACVYDASGIGQSTHPQIPDTASTSRCRPSRGGAMWTVFQAASR